MALLTYWQGEGYQFGQSQIWVHPSNNLGLIFFLVFFLVERVLVLHHRDDAEQARAHHQVGALEAVFKSADAIL